MFFCHCLNMISIPSLHLTYKVYYYTRKKEFQLSNHILNNLEMIKDSEIFNSMSLYAKCSNVIKTRHPIQPVVSSEYSIQIYLQCKLQNSKSKSNCTTSV